MTGKQFPEEAASNSLRQIDLDLTPGKTVGTAIPNAGINEETY